MSPHFCKLISACLTFRCRIHTKIVVCNCDVKESDRIQFQKQDECKGQKKKYIYKWENAPLIVYSICKLFHAWWVEDWLYNTVTSVLAGSCSRHCLFGFGHRHERSELLFWSLMLGEGLAVGDKRFERASSFKGWCVAWVTSAHPYIHQLPLTAPGQQRLLTVTTMDHTSVILSD